MGLYLCIFDDEEELEGVVMGHYSDFGDLRDYITAQLEDGAAGSRFPTFILHSDCDGEWTPYECEILLEEFATIKAELSQMPPGPFLAEWQIEVAKSIHLIPENAFETFIDVDGEFWFDRLAALAHLAVERDLPIMFQ